MQNAQDNDFGKRSIYSFILNFKICSGLHFYDNLNGDILYVFIPKGGALNEARGFTTRQDKAMWRADNQEQLQVMKKNNTDMQNVFFQQGEI